MESCNSFHLILTVFLFVFSQLFAAAVYSLPGQTKVSESYYFLKYVYSHTISVKWGYWINSLWCDNLTMIMCARRYQWDHSLIAVDWLYIVNETPPDCLQLTTHHWWCVVFWLQSHDCWVSYVHKSLQHHVHYVSLCMELPCLLHLICMSM